MKATLFALRLNELLDPWIAQSHSTPDNNILGAHIIINDNTQYPFLYRWRNYGRYAFNERMIGLMEFRLVYDGPLRPNADVKVKHAIRRFFHPQLHRLWKEHQVLAHKWEVVPRVPPIIQPAMNVLRQRGYINNVEGITEVEMLARDFSKCGFRFVPLVNKRFDLVCALNILFLRRGNPGDLVLPGGDIDNRIKTLLDALRVPDNCNELPPNCSPEQDEEPFFCLLQNDSLITELNITTDRLITPDPQQDHRGHEVLLVIHVTLKATKITLENLQLIS